GCPFLWAIVIGGYSGSKWRGLRKRVFGFKSGFVSTNPETRFAPEFRLKAQLCLGGALFRRKHGKPHDCNYIRRNETSTVCGESFSPLPWARWSSGTTFIFLV